MIRWQYLLNRPEFEQALGDGEGQGSLVCCSSWGHKGSGVTEQLIKQAPAVTANIEWYSLKKERNTFQPWRRLYVSD